MPVELLIFIDCYNYEEGCCKQIYYYLQRGIDGKYPLSKNVTDLL